jgi:hypothetical protein
MRSFFVHTGKLEASDVINALRLLENESLSTSQDLLIQKLKASFRSVHHKVLTGTAF